MVHQPLNRMLGKVFSHRNLVRATILFGAFSALKHVNASEQSIFNSGNDVYRMKYTTSIKVEHESSELEYLTKAYRHSNYLMGQLAYSPRRENASATGAPLRKKEDVKITKVKELGSSKTEITYEYDSEVVLDRSGLDHFSLYLPEDYEAIEKMDVSRIAACSFEPGYVDSESLLSIYWTPFARSCDIPYQTVQASLAPVSARVTYPDYPRLVKNGVITVGLLVGKMDENSDHNPYGGDESTSEYRQVVKRMKKLGFMRTNVNAAEDVDHSYEETYEGTFGTTKIVVNTVYGNSVYATDEQKPGIIDFYQHYLKAAKEDSYVVYSGHAGFMLEAGSLEFHEKYPLVLDPNRYQIFGLNGCQTTDYAQTYFGVKSSQNLDLIVNARESIINAKASTAVLDAIVAWANQGKWTSYPTLVGQMDVVDATLGVLGEQDNPTQPYQPAK